MAQRIPLTTRARETFRTILDGQPVRITVWWQPLDASWYMSLTKATIAREPIVTGVRLLGQGVPLAGQALNFKGQFYVEGLGDPGREAWGSTHKLLYLSEAELG